MKGQMTVQPPEVTFKFVEGSLDSIVNEVLEVLKNKPLSIREAIAALQKAERRILGQKISWS